MNQKEYWRMPNQISQGVSAERIHSYIEQVGKERGVIKLNGYKIFIFVGVAVAGIVLRCMA